MRFVRVTGEAKPSRPCAGYLSQRGQETGKVALADPVVKAAIKEQIVGPSKIHTSKVAGSEVDLHAGILGSCPCPLDGSLDQIDRGNDIAPSGQFD